MATSMPLKPTSLPGRGVSGIGPDEDAAVAPLADLEVERQHEVAPGLLGDHHVAAATVRIDGPLLDRHLAGPPAAGLPAVQALAVEEQDPAVLLLLGRERIVGAVGARAGGDPGSRDIASKPDSPIVRNLIATSLGVSVCQDRVGVRGRAYGQLIPSLPLHNRSGRGAGRGGGVAGRVIMGPCRSRSKGEFRRDAAWRRQQSESS